MSPSNSINCTAHSGKSNAELFCEGGDCGLTCEETRSCLKDVPHGEYGPSVAFSMRHPAFLGGIFDIDRWGSKKQVGGSYAHWVIASVKNAKTVRYRTSVHNPRNAVGFEGPVQNGTLPVPPFSKFLACQPNPTGRRLFDFAEESGNEGLSSDDGRIRMFSHNRLFRLCHALGCSFTARAFSL